MLPGGLWLAVDGATHGRLPFRVVQSGAVWCRALVPLLWELLLRIGWRRTFAGLAVCQRDLTMPYMPNNRDKL